MKRVPKKRELTALWLLYTKSSEMNLGMAIDLLRDELCMTKRTASNVIKRLRKLGLVEIRVHNDEIRLKAVSPLSLIENIASQYIELRRKRCKAIRRINVLKNATS